MLRGKLMRVVPRPNDAINETWIADRDRYSYEGVYSADRLESPMVREGGEWKRVELGSGARDGGQGSEGRGRRARDAREQLRARVEELYLLGKLTRALGSANIDHRLRQADFRDQADDPAAPGLGGLPSPPSTSSMRCSWSARNLRREAPVLAHRVRKAAKRGAKVAFLNPARFDYLFPVAAYFETPPARQLADLAAIYSAGLDGAAPPRHLAAWSRGAQANVGHRAIATALKSGQKRAIWLGALALRHPAYADLRAVAAGIAAATGATLGVLAEGGNAAGAYLAGAVPHREPAGSRAPRPARTRARCSRSRRRPIYVRRRRALGRCAGRRRRAQTLGGAELRRRGDAVRR